MMGSNFQQLLITGQGLYILPYWLVVTMLMPAGFYACDWGHKNMDPYQPVFGHDDRVKVY